MTGLSGIFSFEVLGSSFFYFMLPAEPSPEVPWLNWVTESQVATSSAPADSEHMLG